MLTCSALYHHLSWRWDISWKLLSLDHVGISAMIMGGYVPVMQMVAGWNTLAVVVALGVLGWLIEAYKICTSKKHLSAKSGFSFLDILHVVRYLVMGWACLPVIGSMRRELPRECLLCYIIAGVTYSVGVVFFVRGGMEFPM